MRYALSVMVILSAVPQTRAVDDSTVTVSKTWVDRIEQVLNKAGIEIGGELDAGHFGSVLSGAGINPEGRRKEADEFSSIDFDIRLRPHDAIEGRAIVRLHHNWQNFWSDPGNPIFSRWISIDGKIARIIPFHAGDFTARFTPLTLYMPEVDILYEPAIFARLRENAVKDLFIKDNNRPLEGVVMGIDKSFEPLFDTFKIDLIGTRLRSVETSTRNGSFVVTNSEAAPDFSKYFFGTNLDLQLLTDISFGCTYLLIADHINSSKLQDNVAAVSAQRTDIVDFRGGYDIAPLLGLPRHDVRFFGEAAFSFDDTAWYGATNRVAHDRIPGGAAYGGIGVKLNFLRDLHGAADIRYLRNKKDFRNELAQSPCFLGNRIMNIEGDSIVSGNKIILNHYSTFDALYHNVFKFCPSKSTNLWHKAPFTKSSYAKNVYTRNELNSIGDSLLDPAVQLVMPFGPATPDRQGLRIHCTASWESKGIELQALSGFLTNERQPAWSLPDDKTDTFREMGAGLSLDVSKVLRRVKTPFVVSVSYMRSRATDKERDSITRSTDFGSAGLHWRLGKRLSFSSGVERIICRRGNDVQLRQTCLLGGGSLMISRGVDVHGSLGKIWVDNDSDHDFADTPHRTTCGRFRQFISEVSLEVVF
ncbi:MAG: hypothetical protein JW913_08170 [Chitinispirillaceae bacterium]|nr:hypothetical protein [Chitinispirillaceae bacterium]